MLLTTWGESGRFVSYSISPGDEITELGETGRIWEQPVEKKVAEGEGNGIELHLNLPPVNPPTADRS
jgi:hypothetical protein